jgi:hypothetical protein
MRTINVLATQRISADDRAKIEASDPAIRLIDAGGWFDGEIRETWTAFAAARYLPPGATGSGSREERDRLLAEAEVIIGGWPFPVDLRARAPRLNWFHQRQAGASNLLGSDLWGSDVVVTTSRGVANSLPIAEYAVAGMLHFAMGFHRAAIDRDAGAFDHAPIDRSLYRARPPAWSAPAGLEPKSAGSAPLSACGLSGPADSRSRARPCRKASAKSAGRRLSTVFCRKAISSRFAANGPRRPPGFSTKTASRR